MATDQVLSLNGFDADITPFAFQYYAKDFYLAYKNHTNKSKFSPARLFLITRSIELAAKALHLLLKKQEDRIDLKYKINHNLMKSCDTSVLFKFGITLTTEEEQELIKANNYYNGKGFEYFLFSGRGNTVPYERSGPCYALSGWPDLPNEKILESFLQKLLEIHL